MDARASGSRLRATGVLVVALTRVAVAGTPLDRPEAIDADRDAPPPGRVELGFDSGAPVDAWGVGVQLGYVDRPVALASTQPGVTTYPVEHRETLAIGGALALGERFLLDARVPVAHQVGTLAGLGDPQPLAHLVLGDVSLGGRMSVVATGRVALFARLAVALPSGDSHNFAGDPRTTFAASLIARVSLGHGVVVAGTGGIRLRGEEVQVGDRVVGDELFGGVGATVEIPPIAGLWCKPSQLRALAELVGVAGDNVDHVLGPSPAEARIGVIGRPTQELTIGVRAGLGLDDQLGAPRARAMVELAWQPVVAPRPVAPPPAAPPPEPSDDDDE